MKKSRLLTSSRSTQLARRLTGVPSGRYPSLGPSLTRRGFIRTAGLAGAGVTAAVIGLRGVAQAAGGAATVYPEDSLETIQAAIDDNAVVEFAPGDYQLVGSPENDAVLTIDYRSVVLRAAEPSSEVPVRLSLVSTFERTEANATHYTSGIKIDLYGRADRRVVLENLVIEASAQLGTYALDCRDFTMVGCTVTAGSVAAAFGNYGDPVGAEHKRFVDGLITVSGCVLTGQNGLECVTQRSRGVDDWTEISADFAIWDNEIVATRWYGISIIGQLLAPGWTPDIPTTFNNASFTISGNAIRGLYGFWCTALGGEIVAWRNVITAERYHGLLGSAGAYFTRSGSDSRVYFEDNDVFFDRSLPPAPNVLGIGVGLFGPTQNVTIRSNRFHGSAGLAFLLNSFSEPMWDSSDTPVFNCHFIRNDTTDLEVRGSQSYVGRYAHDNVFQHNDYGSVRSDPPGLAGHWVRGNDNRFNDERFWGDYVGKYDAIDGVTLPCILLDEGSQGNTIVALKNGQVLNGTARCNQIVDLNLEEGNETTNIVPGLNSCEHMPVEDLVRLKARIEAEMSDAAEPAVGGWD